MVVRGVTLNRGDSRIELDINENEILDVVVDLTPILATSETVSAASVENSGVSCTATLASPKTTLRFSGLSKDSQGKTELKLTRSGGQVHMIYFLARSTVAAERLSYGRVN